MTASNITSRNNRVTHSLCNSTYAGRCCSDSHSPVALLACNETGNIQQCCKTHDGASDSHAGFQKLMAHKWSDSNTPHVQNHTTAPSKSSLYGGTFTAYMPLVHHHPTTPVQPAGITIWCQAQPCRPTQPPGSGLLCLITTKAGTPRAHFTSSSTGSTAPKSAE